MKLDMKMVFWNFIFGVLMIAVGKMNLNLISSKKTWPVGFYDCLSYNDQQGKNHFCPDFCPKAMIW